MQGPPYNPDTYSAMPHDSTAPPDHTPLTVCCYGLSDTGQVRKSNEDDFLIAELTRTIRIKQARLPQPELQDSDVRAHVLIVADGMGGPPGGEVASLLAVDAIEEFLLNAFRRCFHVRGPEKHEVLVGLRDALVHADARLVREAEQDPGRWGMGTTLTMAYCLGPQAFVAHVGDSRCYRLRAGELVQVTRDHTVVADMVRRGQLRPEEAAAHRHRHVISNVVGGDGLGIEVELHRVALVPGDVLLLCTDGLTEMVPDDGIAAALQGAPHPRAACERLVAAANAAGGRDNVHGGLTLFLASQLEFINLQGKVVSVDYEPKHWQENGARADVPGRDRLLKRIQFIQGSSISPDVVSQILSQIGPDARVLFILDSLHSQEHVLQELKMYSPMVSVGSYLIVNDTDLDHRLTRFDTTPCGVTAAIQEWLPTTDQFVVDQDRTRFLVSAVHGGFLKRIK